MNCHGARVTQRPYPARKRAQHEITSRKVTAQVIDPDYLDAPRRSDFRTRAVERVLGYRVSWAID